MAPDANQVWVQFLNSRKFEWFFTGTTNYPASKKSIRRSVERFTQALSRSYDIEIFWVAEPHKNEGYHIHALIKLRDSWGLHYQTQFNSLRIAWDMVNGKGNHRNKILHIDKKKDSAGYVAKYVTKTYLSVDYDYEQIKR